VQPTSELDFGASERAEACRRARHCNELVRIVRLPDVTARFHAGGVEPSPLGADEFTAFVKSEVEKWAKVVAATGMTAN